MQGRNGDSNIENGLVNTVGERKSEMNGESSTDIYTLPCIKEIAGEKLLYTQGAQPGALMT